MSAAALLAENVTVIVTTSPARSDPELDLLRTTFASLELGGLGQCRKLLVCDCFSVGKSRGGEHSGLLSAERVRSYRARCASFRLAEWARDVEVLELESWHGFAWATAAGLAMAQTPLVCVVQHDLAFLRAVELRPVAELLLHTKGIEFVCLPKPSASNYRAKLRSRTRLEVGAPVRWSSVSGAEVLLTRFPQFQDCTHLARADWYRGIFEQRLLHGARIAKGQFTEDNLGQHMLQLAMANTACEGEEASRGVLDVVDLFGGWLWSDGGPSPIYHLDGRKFLSHAERDVRGIRDTKDVRYRLAAAACQDQGKLMADNPCGNHPAAAAAAQRAQRAQQFLRFLAGVANANCKLQMQQR
jgi:hypothetical protein